MPANDSKSDLPPVPSSSGNAFEARAPGRRHFCVVAGVAMAAACTPGGARIAVGGLHDSSSGHAADGGAPFADGALGDLAIGGDGAVSCGADAYNAGASTAYASGDARLLPGPHGDFYVCRDAGGLFAMTAICPHSGCTVAKQAALYLCPCHGSTFDLNGESPTAPALRGLDHFALCVDASGNVLVDVAVLVDAKRRA